MMYIESNVTLEAVEQLFKNGELFEYEVENKIYVTYERIERIVCTYRKILPETLYTKNNSGKPTRFEHIKTTRQIIMFFAFRYSKMSSVEIGKMFGLSHCTVLHAIKKMYADIKYDRGFKSQMVEMERKLGIYK